MKNIFLFDVRYIPLEGTCNQEELKEISIPT